MKEGRERRAYPRVEMRVPVKYRVIADLASPAFDKIMAEVVEQNSINISAGGACIRTDEPVSQDTVLLLMFEIPGTDAPVKTMARVAWCEDEGAAGYKVGLQYLSLSEEQLASLRERLNI